MTVMKSMRESTRTTCRYCLLLLLLAILCRPSSVMGWSLLTPACSVSHNHGDAAPLPSPTTRTSDLTRRTFLVGCSSASSIATAAATAVVTCIINAPAAALAADATSASEAVRRQAASLPGYGPTDVFYPRSWQGTWKVRRQVSFFGGVGGAAAVGNNNSEQPTSTRTLEYTVRFLPSIQEDAVVADRGFNQANLEAALRSSSSNNDIGAAVRSVQWTETNPNDLIVQLANGTTKNIKVTKRATDRTSDTVQSSEFQRVVVDPASTAAAAGRTTSAVPEITARRVLTKWKVAEAAASSSSPADNNDSSPNSLEALEIVYDMGSQGDPMSYSLSGSGGGPTILSKSRLFLERYN